MADNFPFYNNNNNNNNPFQFQIFKIGVFQETAINLEVEKLNFSNRLELFYSHKMNILNEEVGVVANQLIDLGVIVFGGIKSLVEK